MGIPAGRAGRALSISITILIAAALAGCATGSGAALPASGAAGGPPAEREAPGDTSAQGGAGLVDGNENGAPRDDARIIRTGALQLDVADVRDALRRGRDLVDGMGGYIGASQQYSDGGNLTATVSYRVPVDRWEDALDGFRDLGESVEERTDAIEVTDQIVDLEARIRNLRASETALVRHATDAVKIADLLEIESRLSDVRGQIEQLTAQQAALEDRAAYATLDVTFGTELAALQQAAREWDPKSEVDRAGASLVGVLQALTSAGIWFAIVWLPILLIVGLVVGVGYAVVRRLGFLRRERPPIAPPPPAPAAG